MKFNIGDRVKIINHTPVCDDIFRVSGFVTTQVIKCTSLSGTYERWIHKNDLIFLEEEQIILNQDN